MNFEIVYWHWIALGLLLMAVEIFLLSFTIFWFGIAAIIIGLLLFLVPAMSLAIQIILWAVLSLITAFLWFKYIKPLSGRNQLNAKTIAKLQGEIGSVIKGNDNDAMRGRLRFPAPIAGDDEWDFVSEQKAAVGDRVQIIDVQDNCLNVKKS
ncbi:MAG: NfeD family protein [Alphaproteobacteria bacterium]|nr:NfeD family protein [Alphaproteobacteria bacterium]